MEHFRPALLLAAQFCLPLSLLLLLPFCCSLLPLWLPIYRASFGCQHILIGPLLSPPLLHTERRWQIKGRGKSQISHQMSARTMRPTQSLAQKATKQFDTQPQKAARPPAQKLAPTCDRETLVLSCFCFCFWVGFPQLSSALPCSALARRARTNSSKEARQSAARNE